MKKSTALGLFFVFFLHHGCQSGKIDYMEQSPPNTDPEIFAPGIVSVKDSIEFAPAFSPDGSEFYFTRFDLKENKMKILVMRKYQNSWSDPQTASFSGEYRDGEVSFSLDGKKLFFSSDRPVNPGGKPGNQDIWIIEKLPSGWSEPKNLGPAVNSKDFEGHPSQDAARNLYFHVRSDSAYDIYRSRYINGNYFPREKLSDRINSKSFIEGEPAIAPDGSFLIFVSAGRKDRIAADERLCDLYISFVNDDGSWTKAKCLGSEILSEKEENWPWISPDGKYLFFSSTRQENQFAPDIYWVRTEALNQLRYAN